VTSREAGILIGKDGSQITALREQSNSKITISKMVLKVNERIVQITGTIDTIVDVCMIHLGILDSCRH
jgi:ribosomal protein S3